jgi:hypothetical protein
MGTDLSLDVALHLQTIYTVEKRDHQNSCMSGLHIFNTLTVKAQNSFHLTKTCFASGTHFGPILFRAIIVCTHVDTRASVDCYKRILEQLDLLSKCKSDIQAFNQEVDWVRSELLARGKTDSSLLMHLLQGNKVVTDKDFVS